MNAPERIQRLAELFSLAWTWPTIILGLGVIVHWAPQAFAQIAGHKVLSSQDWLILGIAVGFIGGVIDNAYWGIAWTTEFLDSRYADWWFKHGVFSNIFFRQLCGTYAAYCHMMAYYHLEDKSRVNRWMLGSLIFGAAYVSLLVVLGE